MNITILSVQITSAPNKSGKLFQTADVAYKNNTFQGKIEGKKVTQYSEAAFKVLADPTSIGKTFEVTVEKKDGFNNWVGLIETGVQQGNVGTANVGGAVRPEYKGSATASPRSTYETPEERAKKQVYIVRQSSVGSAIAILSPGAKAPLKTEDVLAEAKKIEAYVFEQEVAGGATGFDDVPDFPTEFQIN